MTAVSLSLDDWTQENGPRWAEQVRALFGDSAEDVLHAADEARWAA